MEKVPALLPAFQALALILQEAAEDLSHSDICKWLSDACRDLPGYGYCYLVDVFGDAQSGDVIICCGGDLKRCSYEITQVNGKSTAVIDIESAEDVLPRTTYEPEADEADHVATMAEARAAGLYTELPAYERFISKGERKAASSGSFAGKGESYPILKPGDVMAAVRSIGRAGAGNYDAGTLKRNIISIAKKRGWAKYLPKAWQSGASEAEAVDLDLTGDVIPLKEGAVGQDGSAFLKLISPGRGSSGYYPAEVLERDGPKVFPKGTKNFWDHQTDIEEQQRPEGSLRNLASVLTEDAHYLKQGPAGPGLYARAKVFEQFRQPVDDLAKHIGMSIRATGKAKEGKAPDGKTGPIIEQLTRGLSIDYVTTPGAGGQVLQLFEAARKGPQSQIEEGADDMDAAEARRLQESNQNLAAEVKKLKERLGTGDAAGCIAEYFAAVRVGEAIQKKVTRRLLERAIPLTADGDLDREKLKALAEAETKDECAYISELSGRRVVVGMGSGQTEQLTEAQQKEGKKRLKERSNEFASLFGFSGKHHKMGRKIMREGRSAFDPEYNANDREQVAVGTEVD